MSSISAHPNVFYQLTYHLVFVTKYRKKCIDQAVYSTLVDTFSDLSNKWGVHIANISGDTDHLHIQLECHPNLNMSKLVNNFKTVSSRLVRKHHTNHISKYLSKGLWSRAYYISTAGIDTASISKYLTDNHHKF